MYSFYKPAHSDYIIHWTGIDIDREYDPSWTSMHLSKTYNQNLVNKYIERLRNILEYGLWMTFDAEDESIFINNKPCVLRPKHARTCFTELRISSARSHASRYGRLGIGFKRGFLFNRMGAPMVYYEKRKKKASWFAPPFTSFSGEQFSKSFSSCFLKPISIISDSDKSREYTYYDESEWRIIYSEEIEKILLNQNEDEFKSITNRFRKVSEFLDDDRFRQSYNEAPEEKKPQYVIPLKIDDSSLPKYKKAAKDDRLEFDQNLAIIIYPSLRIKVAAEADPEIKDLLKKCKPQWNPDLKHQENPCTDSPAVYDRYSQIIGIDLDACRHF